MDHQQLIDLAREASTRAYSPYSGHQAGAVLLSAAGTIHCGANVEIAGSTASCCAVRVALVTAAAAGARDICAVALTSDLPGDEPMICGVCRQSLVEFCAAETPVYLAGKTTVVKTSVGALLSGWKFQPPRWPSVKPAELPAYPAGSTQELIALAFSARERCYAPYSSYYVGAALRATSGKIYLGGNIESAGRTPAICGERNALLQAVFAGERTFTALAVVGARHDTAYEDFACASPCAVCRQALAEFNLGDLTCYLARTPEDYQTHTLDELLPHAFRITSYR